MKTIDTKTLNSVSGAWHGWGGYPGYGYGYSAWNPYVAAYRAEARAAWANAAAANYWAPAFAMYAASRW